MNEWMSHNQFTLFVMMLAIGALVRTYRWYVGRRALRELERLDAQTYEARTIDPNVMIPIGRRGSDPCLAPIDKTASNIRARTSLSVVDEVGSVVIFETDSKEPDVIVLTVPGAPRPYKLEAPALMEALWRVRQTSGPPVHRAGALVPRGFS
jgi:hypothetical protein